MGRAFGVLRRWAELSLVGAAIAACGASTGADYKAIVTDANRPASERELDAARKPDQVLAFYGVKRGDKVADLLAGRGYYTVILSQIVGPEGLVYSTNPRERDEWSDRFKKAPYSNVRTIVGPLDKLALPQDGSLDFVMTHLNHHDLPQPLRTGMNKLVFAALKKGGIYGVVDHSAREGSGERRPVEPPGTAAGADALPARERRALIDAYDGEVRWHDHEIGRLIDRLAAMGRPRPAAVLITSDHGEAFGEHGLWTHGVGLFEELVRVPLVLWSSRERWPARRVATPVSLLDVAPTLCRLALVDPPASFDGASLLPLAAGPDAERTVFMENPATAESGLRDASWAFFETGAGVDARTWLYAASDPRQTENLAEARPEVVARLRAQVEERRARDRAAETAAPTIALDAERRERLRALGYLE